VAISASMMSRWTFWGLMTPVLTALGVVALAGLTPMSAAAALLMVAILIVLLSLMMEGIIRTVDVLHKAFNDNVAMIPQLETARDQALAERVAADEAREIARQATRP